MGWQQERRESVAKNCRPHFLREGGLIMCKVCSIKASWIFVLVICVPGAVIMAEDPSSIREDQAAVAMGGDVGPTPEFKLFERMPVPKASPGVPAKAASYGIVASAPTAGAVFACSSLSGVAYLGYGDDGIQAYGNTMGGYFQDLNNFGRARVGYGTYGIEAEGAWGVRGFGTDIGGYFEDTNNTGEAQLANGNAGVAGWGSETGGYFEDSNSAGWAYVGYGGYKIAGTGSVSFIQNHPYSRDSVIVYAAPEGDEVATYTRGTAKLVDGEATVPLGETFRWVTNPDIGLTTYLTPVGEWSDLYVAERTTEELVVRSAGGARDGAFDYIVYGLRIGFEESSIVQEKRQEAYIPSMDDHRDLYQRRPDLKSYNSLERFKGMRRAVWQKAELDLSRAQALRDAIVEFNPAVHELPGLHKQRRPDGHMSVAVPDEKDAVSLDQGLGESDQSVGVAAPDTQIGGTAIPMDAEGNVYARSFRPSSQDLASLLDVSEAVEIGDVLVADRTYEGWMRRSEMAADAAVVGIVTSTDGVVLGAGVDRFAEVDQQQFEDSFAPVAMSGIVRCKVDASYAAIGVGDLLSTSPTPGHAMRAEMATPGTILAKALESMDDGTGTIRVLVMLR